jgi:hypothetical protein
MGFVDPIAFAVSIQAVEESVLVFQAIAGSTMKICFKAASQISNFHATTTKVLALNSYAMSSFMDMTKSTLKIPPTSNVRIRACKCVNA